MSGSSDDWAKANASIPYTFTIELPGKPRTLCPFEFPASEILGVGKEQFAGLKAMLNSLATNNFETEK